MAIYDGYDEDGNYYDENGYDVFGLDEDGLTYNGFDAHGINKETGTFLDPFGVDQSENGDDEWDAAVSKLEGEESVAAGQVQAYEELAYGCYYDNRDRYEAVFDHLEGYGNDGVRDAVERARDAEDEDEYDDAMDSLKRAILDDIYETPELMDVPLETDIWDGYSPDFSYKRYDIDAKIADMRREDFLRRQEAEKKREESSFGRIAKGVSRILGTANGGKGMGKFDGKSDSNGGPVEVSSHDRHLSNGKVVHVKGYKRKK